MGGMVGDTGGQYPFPNTNAGNQPTQPTIDLSGFNLSDFGNNAQQPYQGLPNYYSGQQPSQFDYTQSQQQQPFQFDYSQQQGYQPDYTQPYYQPQFDTPSTTEQPMTTMPVNRVMQPTMTPQNVRPTGASLAQYARPRVTSTGLASLVRGGR